jgi:DNA repair protein RadC
MQHFATSIICVHNHPSGDPKPSREDKIFTDELVQAGKVLKIKVLDHIIVGDWGYFSFVDEGLMA